MRESIRYLRHFRSTSQPLSSREDTWALVAPALSPIVILSTCLHTHATVFAFISTYEDASFVESRLHLQTTISSTSTMLYQPLFTTSVLLALVSISLAASKRGLIQVSSTKSSDDSTLTSSPSSLSWYYNYKTTPTDNIGLEFVPMLWGPPEGNYNFTAEVVGLLRGGKVSVKYVLGFNEPDMTGTFGGSDMTPSRAAELWKSEIEPLAAQGVKLGAPGISGSQTGKAWLKEFFGACKNCTGSCPSPCHASPS